MASGCILLQKAISLPFYPSKCRKNQSLMLKPSSSESLFRLRSQNLKSAIRIKQLKNRKISAIPVVYAAQTNFLKVIQTVWKVGRDGIEAGTSLVPDTIPRPIARISTTVVVVALALFVLKAFLSTAFFALAVMGLSYFTFIALNKDEGPKGGGGGDGTTSVDDSLEEARRIMDKYK